MDQNQTDKRREYRRKRRVRNQIVAYAFLIILLALVTVGGYFGITKLLPKEQNPVIENDIAQDEPEVETPDIDIPDIPEVEDKPEVVVPELTEEEKKLNEMADAYISQMTLREKVAGLFIVTPEQLTGVGKVTVAGNTTKKYLEKYAVGGLIYFSKNIVGYDSFKTMLSKTKEFSKYPLFLSIDEEGGTVSRVASTVSKIKNVGNMSDIGATGDVNNATKAYTDIAAYLSDLGINLNFAPVADVQTEINNLFAKRSFGNNAENVAKFIEVSVLALQQHKVSACLKHFPGHGATDADSEIGMAVTKRTLDEMRASEFLPFKAGIAAGADFVMIGHIAVPSVTGDNTPATLSHEVITNILREELGFNGIVITDAMNMGAITEYYPSGEAAVSALTAGADMILMPENFEEAYNAVLDAISNDVISEERIDESLRRIYRVKCKNNMATSFEDIGSN